MMEALVQVLYLVTTALLVPVVVVLLGFLAWYLVELGGFLRELRDRRRRAAGWRDFAAGLQQDAGPPDPGRAAAFFDHDGYPGLLAVFAVRGRSLRTSELHLDKVAGDLEIEAGGRLGRMSLGTRVGPMLGLMGTLIPMGPALLQLTSGNIEQMAGNLVVAFSTTVVGLLVGGLCYVMGLCRRRWYAGDLAGIDYVQRCLFEGSDR